MKIIYVVENILMICVPTSFVFANIVMCAKNAKNQKIHCQIFYTTTSCFPSHNLYSKYFYICFYCYLLISKFQKMLDVRWFRLSISKEFQTLGLNTSTAPPHDDVNYRVMYKWKITVTVENFYVFLTPSAVFGPKENIPFILLLFTADSE